MIAMEARSTTSLADLKASLLQASSQGDSQGFPTLQNSLKDVLDGYSQAQKGSAAAGHLAEDVATFNDTVSKARQQLQAKCELLQVRHISLEWKYDAHDSASRCGGHVCLHCDAPSSAHPPHTYHSLIIPR